MPSIYIHECVRVDKLVPKWQSKNRVHAYKPVRMIREICDRLVRPIMDGMHDQLLIPFENDNLWHHIHLHSPIHHIFRHFSQLPLEYHHLHQHSLVNCLHRHKHRLGIFYLKVDEIFYREFFLFEFQNSVRLSNLTRIG